MADTAEQVVVSHTSTREIAVPTFKVRREARGGGVTATAPVLDVQKDVLAGATDETDFIRCRDGLVDLFRVLNNGIALAAALRLTPSASFPGEELVDYGIWVDSADMEPKWHDPTGPSDTSLLGGGAGGGTVDTAGTGLVLSGGGTTLSLSVPVAVAHGGTGDTTAAGARTNLGLVIGTDVQAYHARLADVAGIATTKGNLIVANGTNLAALAAGTDGHVLTLDSAQALGVKWAAGGGGGSPNDLLDGSTHQDTLAGTVVRGDVIVGNATPKWARLAKGAANTVLSSDGTDTVFQALTTLLANVLTWTSFTPTGTWSSNCTYTGKYFALGKLLLVQVNIAIAGSVGTPGGLEIDVPTGFAMATSDVIQAACGYGIMSDAGVIRDLYCGFRTSPSTTIVVRYKNGTGTTTNLTHSAPVTPASGDEYHLFFWLPTT